MNKNPNLVRIVYITKERRKTGWCSCKVVTTWSHWQHRAQHQRRINGSALPSRGTSSFIIFRHVSIANGVKKVGNVCTKSHELGSEWKQTLISSTCARLRFDGSWSTETRSWSTTNVEVTAWSTNDADIYKYVSSLSTCKDIDHWHGDPYSTMRWSVAFVFFVPYEAQQSTHECVCVCVCCVYGKCPHPIFGTRVSLYWIFPLRSPTRLFQITMIRIAGYHGMWNWKQGYHFKKVLAGGSQKVAVLSSTSGYRVWKLLPCHGKMIGQYW